MNARLFEELRGAMHAEGAMQMWSRLAALRDTWPTPYDWDDAEIRTYLRESLRGWHDRTQRADAPIHGVWRLVRVTTHASEAWDGQETGGVPFSLSEDVEAGELSAFGDEWIWREPEGHFLELSPDGRWREVVLSARDQPATAHAWQDMDELGDEVAALPPESHWFQSDHVLDTSAQRKYAGRFGSADELHEAESGPIPAQLAAGAHHMLMEDMGDSWSDLELADRLEVRGARLRRVIYYRWDGVYAEAAELLYTQQLVFGG